MNDKQKASILIVDDLPENLYAMEAVIGKLNQNLYFAKSGREALRLLLQHEFAVILLDINMPDLDGFNTARLIRSREKNSYTPIIFLSSLNKDDIDIEEGYSIGVSDFIFKPINPVILISKIKVFIDLFTKSSLAINLQNELKKREDAEKNMQRQLRQLNLAKMDRFSCIKELTSAIAHELNQPLTAISNYMHGCVKFLEKDHLDLNKLKAALLTSTNEAQRAGKILHRIKNFASKNSIFIEQIQINHLIRNISALLEEEFKKNNIKLVFRLSSKITDIPLDKLHIEQVIINLLKNSIEALEATSHRTRKISIITTHNKDNKLLIILRDNGPGIHCNDLDKLFNIYFTTKEKGTGIGLAICRAIIEAHGGNIAVKNNPRGGASFIINLPSTQ